VHQHAPGCVIAYLADETGSMTGPGGRRRHVGGTTPSTSHDDGGGVGTRANRRLLADRHIIQEITHTTQHRARPYLTGTVSTVGTPYTPILGTLAYLWDRSTDRVLMVLRNARPDDEHLGKFNGLGGKLEPGEDIVEGIRREIREEAELEVTSMVLRGTINWPGFGAKGEDWFGFVFLVEQWTGEPLERNPEGELVWIDRSRLLQACSDDDAERDAAALPMWEGDRWFVPLVFDDDDRAFHGVMPYSQGRPQRWSYQRLTSSANCW
jgi:8-oxo-dGTP diphosphatase